MKVIDHVMWYMILGFAAIGMTMAAALVTVGLQLIVKTVAG